MAARSIGPFDSMTGGIALANALVAGAAVRLRDTAPARLDMIESVWGATAAVVAEPTGPTNFTPPAPARRIGRRDRRRAPGRRAGGRPTTRPSDDNGSELPPTGPGTPPTGCGIAGYGSTGRGIRDPEAAPGRPSEPIASSAPCAVSSAPARCRTRCRAGAQDDSHASTSPEGPERAAAAAVAHHVVASSTMLRACQIDQRLLTGAAATARVSAAIPADSATVSHARSTSATLRPDRRATAATSARRAMAAQTAARLRQGGRDVARLELADARRRWRHLGHLCGVGAVGLEGAPPAGADPARR